MSWNEWHVLNDLQCTWIRYLRQLKLKSVKKSQIIINLNSRRRLYLLRGQDGRPVSYSFENSCSSSPQGVKPGKPTPFSGRSHHSQLSSSDLHLNSHEEFRTPMRGRVDSVDNRYSIWYSRNGILWQLWHCFLSGIMCKVATHRLAYHAET